MNPGSSSKSSSSPGGQRRDASIREISSIVESSRVAEILWNPQAASQTEALSVSKDARRRDLGATAYCVRVTLKGPWVVNIHPHSRLNRHTFVIGLDFFRLDIDALNKFRILLPDASIPDDVRCKCDFLPVGVRKDSGIQMVAGVSELNAQSAREEED